MRKRITNLSVDKIIKDRNINRIDDVSTFHTAIQWMCSICDHRWIATPNNVINRGTGCPKCKDVKLTLANKSRTLTTEEFIQKAKIVHKNTYDYSNTNYNTSKHKVSIMCTIHGEFNQTPNVHLQGSGCPRCSRMMLQKYNSQLIEYSANSFIGKATTIHNNKYTYPNFKYVNNRTKIDILCPTHGIFQQAPNKHLTGCGCPICGNDALYGHYTHDYFNRYPHEKTLIGWLYVLILQDKIGSNFVKVGITKRKNIDDRIIQYKNLISVYETKQCLLLTAFQLEQQILKHLETHKYIPSEKFSGHTECLQYSTDVLCQISQFVNSIPNISLSNAMG